MRLTTRKILALFILLGIIGSVAIAAQHAPSIYNTMAATQTEAVVLPSAAVRTPVSAVRAWHPRIAFQYYDGDKPSSEYLATHVDWLMMRYGAEQRRQEVYAHGYRGLILQYVLAYQIEGPGPYKNKHSKCKSNYTPLRNNVMWTKDFCKTAHKHEDWFLHNGKGQRLYTKDTNWDGTPIYSYYMNPASEGFRRFWVEQIQKQHEAGWQGFFLDNVGVSYAYLANRPTNKDGKVKEYSSDEAWHTAVTGFLDYLHSSFPKHPIWGNMIESDASPRSWEPFLDHLDGFQEENFATNWLGQPSLNLDQWNAMMTRAEQAIARGKGVVLYGQGEHDDLERMRFSLASYLLIATADERATFRYAHTGSYPDLWWYPEYDMNLGLPRGPRYLNGSLWIRDFQCGQVIVDPAQHTGRIEQRPCQS